MGATPTILQPSEGQLVVHDGWEALIKLAGNPPISASTLNRLRCANGRERRSTPTVAPSQVSVRLCHATIEPDALVSAD